MKFKYREDECVALKKGLPEHDLKAGDIGRIWALYLTDPPSYEVTFRLPDGSNLGMIMEENELEAPQPAG